MTVSERMSNAGLVPVVVLENAADAVPTARALLAGGVDVMEITFRTAAAEDSIRAVAQECDEMVVGAGTVVTLEQCQRAVDAGAQFIVSPGYDDEVVAWCDHCARLRDADGDHGGHETRAFGAQVLPGGGVWRAFGHEGAQRAVWLDPLCAHGRCE